MSPAHATKGNIAFRMVLLLSLPLTYMREAVPNNYPSRRIPSPTAWHTTASSALCKTRTDSFGSACFQNSLQRRFIEHDYSGDGDF